MLCLLANSDLVPDCIQIASAVGTCLECLTGFLQDLDMPVLSDRSEQLQEQLQTLQAELAKQKCQAARAQAKADHYKCLYKQATSTTY